MASSEMFHLKQNYVESMNLALNSWRETPDFSDVTLVAQDNQKISAHRVLLAASSTLFMEILKADMHSNPTVFMDGFDSKKLRALVDFMYCGEVIICQGDLDDFISMAEDLQIKGLAEHITATLTEPITRKTFKSTRYKTQDTSISENSSKIDTEIEILNKPTVFEASAPKTPTPIDQHAYESQIPIHKEKDFPPIWRRSLPVKKVRNKNKLKSIVPEFEITYQTAINEIQTGIFLPDDHTKITEQIMTMMENAEGLEWNCKVCGKNGSKGNIQRHIERYHLSNVHKCNTCHTVFKTKTSLKNHNIYTVCSWQESQQANTVLEMIEKSQH